MPLMKRRNNKKTTTTSTPYRTQLRLSQSEGQALKALAVAHDTTVNRVARRAIRQLIALEGVSSS
jgi:hypothetical protein